MKSLQTEHSYTQSHDVFFEYDFNESTKSLKIVLQSFDSALFARFIDFLIIEHGIDVAAKLVDGVKLSSWSVSVCLRGVVFDCEIIRLREFGDAAGPVAGILR